MTTRQVKTLKIKRRPTQEYDNDNQPIQNEHYIEETTTHHDNGKATVN